MLTFREMIALFEAADPQAKRQSLVQLYARLPDRWQNADGSIGYRRPAWPDWLATQPDSTLDTIEQELKTLLASAQPISAPPEPERDADDLRILHDMFARADEAAFREWALEHGADESDLANEEMLLSEFEYWLEQTFSIHVRNGMVAFWTLGGDAEEMIGENPIVLYHFTSSTRLPAIRKEGLVAHKRSVNRRTTEAVFLTTETDGPAVRGYLYNALRKTKKGYGVCLTIRTYLSEVQPDPDDADLSSGAHQFITDYVAPEQIVAVDRAAL